MEPALLPFPSLLLTFVSVALIAGAFSAPALAAGPFETLSGSWTGTGTVHPQGGSPERVRCNATYRPEGGSGVSVHLRCASDSYNFNLSGQITTDGNSLHGQWTENSRGTGGTVSGTVRGDHMQVHIDSAGFSADLGITTRGKRQDVSVDSHGCGEVVKGSISMNRR
jgi:hypothetical protein